MSPVITAFSIFAHIRQKIQYHLKILSEFIFRRLFFFSGSHLIRNISRSLKNTPCRYIPADTGCGINIGLLPNHRAGI